MKSDRSTFKQEQSRWRSLLGGLSRRGYRSCLLFDLLDHTHRDGVLHVADGKAAKRRVLGKRLHHEGLRGNEDHQGAVTSLESLGILQANQYGKTKLREKVM